MPARTEPGAAERPVCIRPGWPAPPRVHAASTLRDGGSSVRPFDTLNLGTRCGDDPEAVARNRDRLQRALTLPAPPRWLDQVHGARIVDPGTGAGEARADGAVTASPGIVCAVLTADCLPVLLCDRDGTRVGAVHAGWRGMAAGVIESAVTRMSTRPAELIAWLGPAIGPDAYEVGHEVREALAAGFGDAALEAFRPSPAGRWLADLYALARLRLALAGVSDVYGGDRCTHGEPDAFFSYRRDGETGRMATLIWLHD